MRIMYRYLLKELAGPFFTSLFVTTAILAAGNIVQTVDMVVNKGVDMIQVVKIFLFFLPYVLIFTIPISVLSAVLLGFGRLSGDNEITALRTSGVSLWAMMLPVMVSGLIVSLLNVPLNDKILPQSEYCARKLIKQVGAENPTALLEAGVFVKGFKDYIVFIHGISGQKLSNIRIYQPCENGPTRTIIAEKGEIISEPAEKSVKLKLENGTADELSPENPGDFYKLTFKEYYMTLDLDKNAGAENVGKKAREKSIRELMEEIAGIKGKDRRDVPLRIEIHKKLALAFSNFVFVLIGIPLAITTHRREKFIGFGLAMGLFMLYWGLMLAGIAFAIRFIVPPWVGVWSADVILLAIAGIMLYKLTAR